jgi:hypothetical protein
VSRWETSSTAVTPGTAASSVGSDMPLSDGRVSATSLPTVSAVSTPACAGLVTVGPGSVGL